MGWLYTSDKSFRETAAEYLTRRALRWSSVPPEAHPQVVASSTGSNHVVFAVRFPAAHLAISPGLAHGYVVDLDGSITVALFFLVAHNARAADGMTFGYKDMSESMGPYETCSPGIFKHLSAVDMSTDTGRRIEEWRAKCRAAAAVKSARAKIGDGAKVTLAVPLSFTDGSQQAEFIARRVPYSRRGKVRNVLRFQAPNGGHYRLTSRDLANATVTK